MSKIVSFSEAKAFLWHLSEGLSIIKEPLLIQEEGVLFAASLHDEQYEEYIRLLTLQRNKKSHSGSKRDLEKGKTMDPAAVAFVKVESGNEELQI